ncbi:crocetin glucosyltransferase, chloroplastic-like [Juglans regia]|uniref:Glycosyltransferase n=2 Tax=Juglans regia TaxID=51240 RepID=A0A2I4GXB6_JUGRE|nr:crocetin glucosyltransferase, chloroplastic-like [Juglans regia]XP_035539531.1 crocetin glucosyltransferase, chloroplastic-like [Juglans regia]XP_035539532.1 crocetin glucosyltransferase, chloroplastic-like [Juglans regia]XP_035539533.1 crocetin glucosyltransferase, chloroplastic-like [Juglans regia]XP_035539534.1 crocetin glucosyltransferase, chloroplastic-like [Juglans regia]XP_035539535.1 crocetin glucosyltransferase, chloroplastic-like [Juglans regia]
MVNHHFLLVIFPAQGHINPALQFAKRLIRLGAHVTFATTVAAHRRMNKSPTPDGLSFATFSDGYDDGGFKHGDHDFVDYMSELKRRGSQTLTDLVVSSANKGRTFTCLVYSILLPWACDVARELHLLSALLWIQPATVLDIYYYYFNGYGDVIRNIPDPSFSIELPGLPSLTSRDLPSFMADLNTHTFALPLFQEHFEELGKESNPRVLVNTFDALEPEALRAIERFSFTGIGPLIPSAFLDGKDPSDTAFGGDLFQGATDYIEWLNSKPSSSVIYVSFGSLSLLAKNQMEEIARGLLDYGCPFLWVKRANENGEEKEEDRLSCREELEQKGKFVQWCSQVEVLSHPSVACFVTHCGWNSTLESLVSGVPLVAFPQWTDQGTNAKLVQDVWKIGLRVTTNKDGIVEGDEIKRCLELVLGNGERGEEMRKNAKKWKDLAREAAMEGGTSYNNLKAFVDEFGEGPEGC